MRMTYGKHRGKELSDPTVPLAYLGYVVEGEVSSPPLRRAAIVEMTRRLQVAQASELAVAIGHLQQGLAVFGRYAEVDSAADEWLDAVQGFVIRSSLRGKAT